MTRRRPVNDSRENSLFQLKVTLQTEGMTRIRMVPSSDPERGSAIRTDVLGFPPSLQVNSGKVSEIGYDHSFLPYPIPHLQLLYDISFNAT